MENLWLDTSIDGNDDLDNLVYLSRVMGLDSGLVLWGGGNTSVKSDALDFRGRPIRGMLVKGSGSDMKDSERRHFPTVDLDGLAPLFERDVLSDEDMVNYIRQCMLDQSAPRPSIETLLHAFLPHKFVAHSHADTILSITNNARSDELLNSIYGKEATLVRYRRPGFLLAKEVALATLSNPLAKSVILINHGLVTWGATGKQAYESHIEMVNRAEEAIAKHAVGRTFFGPAAQKWLDSAKRNEIAASVAPMLRGLISGERRVVLKFNDAPEVMEIVNSRDGKSLSQIGAATPDHTLHTKRLPLWIDSTDSEDVSSIKANIFLGVSGYVQQYRQWFEEHSQHDSPMLDPNPRVILLPGVGMWTTAQEARLTIIPSEIYQHTIGIIKGAEALGNYQTLTAQDSYDAEYWPLELYKLSLLPPEKELARRVAVITGGASGIGRAIARRFASEGAHVVVADLDAENTQHLVSELNQLFGVGRAVACPMDVTNEEDVKKLFTSARLEYGGIDVVVSNAGVASPGIIEELSLEDWRKSMDVNATSHFLVSREAVKLLREQDIGGSMIFVGTKNVPAPGKEFGAYSASKAAEAQLARVLAIENGEYGIRVNIINPDAVFRDSKLWSEEVRNQRASAHGIAVDDLEEFYRKRNLLQRIVTAEDVAEVALFLAGDRAMKTTGAVIPVDGGLREAFPR